MNRLSHLPNQVEILAPHLAVPLDVVQHDLSRAKRLGLAREADRVR